MKTLMALVILFSLSFTFSVNAGSPPRPPKASKAMQQLIQACNLIKDPRSRAKCLRIRKVKDWKQIEKRPAKGNRPPHPPRIYDLPPRIHDLPPMLDPDLDPSE